MNTIDYYRSIAEASSRMVSAARSGDWDALVNAEEECAQRVADFLASTADRAGLELEWQEVFPGRSNLLIRLTPAGLVARRPDCAARRVPQVQVAAPRIARHVLPPTRHREVAPAAVPGSGRGHHHRVPAVRQQVRPRRLVVR